MLCEIVCYIVWIGVLVKNARFLPFWQEFTKCVSKPDVISYVHYSTLDLYQTDGQLKVISTTQMGLAYEPHSQYHPTYHIISKSMNLVYE